MGKIPYNQRKEMTAMKSLRRRIPMLMCMMTIPIAVFAALTLWYAGRQMRRQIIDTNASALNFYTNELDNSLNDIQSYLLNFSVFNNGAAEMSSSDHDTRKIAQSKVFEKLRQDAALYNADCLFAYAPEYDCLAIIYSGGIDYADALALHDLLKKDYESVLTNFRWKVRRLAGEPYLYQINLSRMQGTCVFGALYDVSGIQNRLMNSTENMTVVLTGTDAKPLIGAREIVKNEIELIPGRTAYSSGVNKDIVLSSALDKGLILWAVFPSALPVGSLSWFFKVMASLTVLIVLVMTLSSVLAYRWVLLPLAGIDHGLKALRDGNLDYRMETGGLSSEYAAVSSTFNAMAEQIRDLKIRVYEENLHRQESELNFLYMQMRPHFFLNALTTIRNFASLGQYENMYDFLGFLGRYIRYSLRRSLSDVPLSQEIDHIDNYISLQNLQHPGAILFMTDIDERAPDCLIPPFTVYTFAENCIKHALSLEVPLSIFITASVHNDRLYISVEDDSTGFPEEILKKAADPSWLDDPGEKHIGIRNVKKTLLLRYGEKAGLTLSNAVPSGARVELLLPARFAEPEEPAVLEEKEEKR